MMRCHENCILSIFNDIIIFMKFIKIRQNFESCFWNYNSLMKL